MTSGHESNPGQPALADRLSRWRDDLGAWAIPDHIMAGTTESPWVLPTSVFARRADKYAANPEGASFERAWAGLVPPGSVLDVGAGAGAASLPLAARTTALTAVDTSQEMLDLLADRAAARHVPVRTVRGSWPQSAPEVPTADLVTCHHVLYNVADVEPFTIALTEHARRLVIVEIAMTHPLSSLNDLWFRFHGLRRPAGPTSDDLLGILTAMGLQVGSQRWRRTGGPDYASMAELVDVTRRRLCLPPQRAAEVAEALVEAGVDPAKPQDLGSSGRDVLTIWWKGSARELRMTGQPIWLLRRHVVETTRRRDAMVRQYS